MQVKNASGVADLAAREESSGDDLLRPLVVGQSTRSAAEAPLPGVVIGELLAMTNDGRTPLVAFPGQKGSAAVAARTTVDLHGAHIGRQVVLTFEGGDVTQPIVLGVLTDGAQPGLDSTPDTVDVDADGQRLVVSAKQQLVLRCGKARITLTCAGKVLIEGEYISSRSSSVNRIKGGSVQLN